MMFIYTTLLIIRGFTDSRSEQYIVVGPTDPVLVVAGEVVILPCIIKPDTSAEDMRVEWFRLDLQDSVVHLYEDHKDTNTDQSQSYRGRTQLFNQELQKGNASLKLSTVQVSDEGLYKCFVQSKSWYDDITLNVTVEAVGTQPLITIDGFDHSGGVHLQCESKGWNPEPELVWLDHEGVALKSEATDTQRDTDRFSVKHTITVYNSDSKYHCRVQIRHHMLETEIITSKQYIVVGPTDPVLAVADEDVILPCTIKPDTSAEDMRVEWFRLDLQDSVVHLYEDHKDRNTYQSQSYRGRTQLFKQELQKGNASLKLSTVQLSDEGLYKCLIKSKSWYDDITLNVTVEAVGTQPLITIDGFDHSGGVHLQCESKGWYPEPELVWLDHEGVTLKSEATDTQRDTDGFSVKHTITVYNSDSKYHCRVQMRHHMLETEIITSSKTFNSWRMSVIWTSVAVVFSVIVVILIAAFIHKHRDLNKKGRIQEDLNNENRRIQEDLNKKRRIQEELNQHLQKQKIIIPYVITLFRKHAVNVTLDPDSAHPRLTVSDDGKQVRGGKTRSTKVNNRENEQSDTFDEYLAILGKEGFSSGCFYFEVQVTGQTRWDLGVTRESTNRKGIFDLKPETGYWTVQLRYRKYWACDSESVSLSPSVKPWRVGVFVDYEEGLVSFYDVEDKSHIYSFTGQSFTEKLYPFVCLGYDWNKNPEPLIICNDF
ncbi:butyrophilin subfamily 2 member A2-like isoform X3 [Myxocyprinus asiaticus]|uniref:butyrophilin subfamily 2 member A2-like isoform X2 n=1 Tax=Myxocyprinus asiaticus TaxID=70543 RepID=UPI00222205F3|nr:butyrophilin subfamily 2 member A2-like isoform X2 [Myxocyprinus asiaticus]XP_051570087.1 butyrophilin subfamily 2 member A2-like isoform X3 [Myxocyprinus asiaticus]